MSKVELLEALADAWEVSPEEFPASGSPAEKLTFLLSYAVLAPSSHNSQPWLFRVREDYVELYADRTRALPVVDPEDRELLISCGAALFHLCIAMRHFGYEDDVALFPDPQKPDLLARVRMRGPWQATHQEHELFYPIVARHTNRQPFFDRPVPAALIAELEKAAGQQGAWLHVLRSDEERTSLAVLTSEADTRFRRELASWMHPNRSLTRDGLPGYAIGMSDLISMAGPVVIRTFDLGNGRAASDLDLATGSPLLVILGTPGDTPRDWIKAGEALARVLLRATAESVSASFLNQPIEVPEFRRMLSDITGREGFPQIVLRLGYGPDVGLTPRRTVREVLI
jgi:hypothetical protein